MTGMQVDQQPIHLYKRRWIFLALLTLLGLLNGVSYSMFGQISYFFVEYFDVTYAQVDWMTVSSTVFPLVMTIPLSWLAYKRILGFRLMAISAAVTTAVGFICFALSMVDRSLFSVAIVGQTVMGVPQQLILTTPSIFACLWFPENEVGTAIGVNAMGNYAGFAIGVLVPATLLTQYNNNLSSLDNQKVLQDQKFSLLCVYCICAFLAVVISILFCVFVTDVPSSPPTNAQQCKRSTAQEELKSDMFWSQMKTAFTNRTFLFATIIFAIEYQSNTVEFTMMSQIVREVSNKHGLGLNPPIVGSWALCCYACGSVVGTVFAGRLVDKFKNYKLLSRVSTFLVCTSSVVVLLGIVVVKYLSLLLYIGNVFIGFFSQIALVALYDLTTQETYPIDETVVTLWLTGIVQPSGLLYSEIGRGLYGSFQGIGVLSFQAVSYFIGFAFCFCLTPVYGRLDFDNAENDTCTETTSLVINEEHQRKCP